MRLITASAGSGKTTRLTRELAARMGTADRVIATTFTRKAARELHESARRTLLAAGRWQDAQLLSAGWIGTVNAVCGELVAAHALEMGLPPDCQVVPEQDTAALLQTAMGDALCEQPWAERAREAAWAFSFTEQRRRWQDDVLDVMGLGRANGLDGEGMRTSARRSVEGMLALLDPPSDGARLDADLLAALDACESALGPFAGTAKNTSAALELVARSARRMRLEGRITWADWARLAALDAGKAHRAAAAPVRAAAEVWMSHPRLRVDLSDYVTAVFHFASRGLERYRAFKRKHRLVDFLDQEELALELLGRVRLDLDLLLVDEFQDTSPIQLAVFMRLSSMARESVWVGDPRQSIYGFRGADPELMRQCVERADTVEVLGDSWRSRPGLVRAVGEAFGGGAALVPRRPDFDGGEPLAVWRLGSSNKAGDKAAIAEGVRGAIGTLRVADRASGEVRVARPGDVAVLCATNDDCLAMAGALAAAGVPASVARAGLLSTMEGTVAEAALRVLLDASDVLAAGTVAFFERGDGEDAEAWLEAHLRNLDDGFGWSPGVRRLREARGRLTTASPLEALDVAMEAAGLHAICLRYGDVRRRLDNLAALRGMAHAYQESCGARRCAATAAGLVLHLQGARREGRDVQAAVMGDAVSVLTCHASKGLEWPVVVLADLDRGTHPEPFGVRVEAPGTFDVEAPLAGRWVRMWLTPTAGLRKDVPFVARACASTVGDACAARDLEEEARLLYVAMTRARDVLVLAVREEGKAGWLERVVDGGVLRRWYEGAVDVGAGEGVGEVADERWFEAGVGEVARAAEVAARAFPCAGGQAGEAVLFATRQRLRGCSRPEERGAAVHAYLAAEPLDDSRFKERFSLAGRVLRRFGQVDALREDDLISAGDLLRQFVASRWPEARWHREVPLAFRVDGQEVRGIADLLLECPDGWVVIDHKSWNGPPETWAEKAAEYYPQLAAYARGVEMATGGRVLGCWLHFPLGGGILEVFPCYK